MGHGVDDLQSLLNPQSDTYQTWKDSNAFVEWQSYVKSLCKILEAQIESL